jgi:hypothetical protein
MKAVKQPSMSSREPQFVKALIAALTLLIAVQPLSAYVCWCDCHKPRAISEEAHCGVVKSSCPSSCSHADHRTHPTSDECTVESIGFAFGCHPCHCPQECDCQARRATNQFFETNGSDRSRADVVVLTLDTSTQRETSRPKHSGAFAVGGSTRSQAPLRAQLCRFVI